MSKYRGLAEPYQHRFEYYPNSQLMFPKMRRMLTQAEQEALVMLQRNRTGRNPPDAPEAVGSVTGEFEMWARALAGRAFWNEHGFEVMGSAMRRSSSRNRDNSHMRYMFKIDQESGSPRDVSYFGRVLFFMSYTVQVLRSDRHAGHDVGAMFDSDSSDDERRERQVPQSYSSGPRRAADARDSSRGGAVKEFFVAYVENFLVGRTIESSLACELEESEHGQLRGRDPYCFKEFIELDNIQECVGFVCSRGRRFVVNKNSCFWEVEDVDWSEAKYDEVIFAEGP